MTTSTSTPLVSVVIPAHNAARTLPAALRSVLDQSFDDFEILVVDDGSTDSTGDVARSLADPRIHVLRQANKGHAAARNAGIRASRGIYVAFLDADNIWLRWKLERQLTWLRCRSVRAVQAGTYYIADDLTILYERRCQPSSDPLLDSLYFRNLPDIMSTLIAERTLLDEVGGFDSSLLILQDWDLAIRLARTGNLNSIPDALSGYRLHSSNQSRQVDLHVEPGLKVLHKVFADPTLPDYVRQRQAEIYARFYTMLCGGAFRVKDWRLCLRWGVRALRTDPRMVRYMAALPARRRHRLDARRGQPVFAPQTLVPGQGDDCRPSLRS